MKSRRRPSYFWARGVDWREYNRLSEAAMVGLDLAARLAEDALFRRELALRREPLAPALAIRELAEEFGFSEGVARARIRQARRELYGELCDRAIYTRRARLRELAKRAPRACVICDGPLPMASRSDAQTCSGKCRKRLWDLRRRTLA